MCIYSFHQSTIKINKRAIETVKLLLNICFTVTDNFQARATRFSFVSAAIAASRPYCAPTLRNFQLHPTTHNYKVFQLK